MDVVTLPWPAHPEPVDSERIDAARAAGQPILLLVADEAEPPPLAGCLEDWVRLGAPEIDRRARSAALSARAAHHGPRPALDGEGVLRYRDRWACLSPVEHRLAASLVERFGAVVGRDSLSRRAWPDGVPSRNALDVHMLRLRRRLDPLGLEVRTVRARGYLLQTAGG
jgi:hypothetical protein